MRFRSTLRKLRRKAIRPCSSERYDTSPPERPLPSIPNLATVQSLPNLHYLEHLRLREEQRTEGRSRRKEALEHTSRWRDNVNNFTLDPVVPLQDARFVLDDGPSSQQRTASQDSTVWFDALETFESPSPPAPAPPTPPPAPPPAPPAAPPAAAPALAEAPPVPARRFRDYFRVVTGRDDRTDSRWIRSIVHTSSSDTPYENFGFGDP